MDPELLKLLLQAVMQSRGLGNMADVTSQAPQSYGDQSDPLTVEGFRSSIPGMVLETTPPGSVAGGAYDIYQGAKNRDPQQAAMGLLGMIMLGGLIGNVGRKIIKGEGLAGRVLDKTAYWLAGGRAGEEAQAMKMIKGAKEEEKLAKVPIEDVSRHKLHIRGASPWIGRASNKLAISTIKRAQELGRHDEAAKLMKLLLEAEKVPLNTDAEIDLSRRLSKMTHEVWEGNMKESGRLFQAYMDKAFGSGSKK